MGMGEDTAPRRLPLQGIRVIDFTWVLAGPYCTRMLADLGAEVIKVQSAAVGQETISVRGFTSWNRNKLGITLNMSTPHGREVCKRLIAVSDVVVENFSARVIHQWGLDWENLEPVNPGAILVSMAGFGHTGPLKDFVSFGPTIQAMSGITALSTFPGHGPLGFGYSYADHVGGIMGAMAVLQALNYRQRTGKGQFVDVAQLEGLTALLSTALLQCSFNGRPPKPLGNKSVSPAAAPHDVYRCLGDDRWVAIAVFTDEEWRAFALAVGEPAWTKDPRFATMAGRQEHTADLDRLVEEWTLQHTAEEVMSLLQKAGVAAGVVQNGQDLVENDPHLQERGFFVEAIHPELGKIIMDGLPFKLSRTPMHVRQSSPLWGQDNEYVFKGILGMNEEEFTSLTEGGILQ